MENAGMFGLWEKERSMTEQKSFRQQLDAVLRTQNVERVREFLIAEEQWSEEVPADPQRAMWMMIAGSATLGDMHERAREWLVSHGHEAEAEAILGRSGKKQEGKKGQQGGKKTQQGPQTRGAGKGERRQVGKERQV